MLRKVLGIMIILVVFITVGCTDSNDKKNDSIDSSSEPFHSPPPTSTIRSEVPDLKLEGDIDHIYYAGDDKLLISAEKLYLYHVKRGESLKGVQKEAANSENYWVIDSGYVAVRETIGSSSGVSMMTGENYGFDAIFYDHELNKLEEFDMNQLLEEDDMFMSIEAISFSSNGKKVAYATYSGLYVYNFETNSKSKVIDLDNENFEGRLGIVNVEHVEFTNNDNTIAFKAQSLAIPLDPDKPSFDTCGVIQTDGTGLLNKTFDGYLCKQITSYQTKLLLTEDPTVVTGKTLVMDVTGKDPTFHKLIEKEESGNVWGSDGGKYFATSVLGKSGWKIRVYNMETGELEMEEEVSSDGESRYLEHDPIILVIDHSRTCIVLMGSKHEEVETKMVVSPF